MAMKKCLFVFGAAHAAADVNEAMKIKAMSKFMPGSMPRPITQGTGISGASSPTQTAMLKALADLEVQSQEMKAEYQRLEAAIQNMPQADDQASGSFGWLAGFLAAVGLAASAGVAAVRKYSGHGQQRSVPQRAGPIMASASRTRDPKMYNIDAYDDIWGLPAKEEVYAKWDPEKPRDYFNFNPFERNDEGQQCDSNGCFPGQDGAYMPPNRPDVNWEIMQEHNKRMDALKAEAKFNLKGKPGNWVKGWAKNLGPTP